MEIWKPIAGFDKYEVSNLGRVKSFKQKKPRIMKLQPDDHGYLQVQLFRNGKGKNCKVYRLVAEAFIENPENKPEVDHKNGDKSDCRVENLNWVTSSENKRRAVKNGQRPQGEDNYNASLTNKQAQYVRNNPDNLSIAELAEKLGVTKPTISEVQIGDTYKNAGGKTRESKKPRVPDEIRAEIRRLYVKGSREFGTTALAKKYNVDPKTIWNIVREGQPMNTLSEP